MALFQIWSEGFHVMEGKSGASHQGEAEAPTFAEACAKHFAGNNLFDPSRLTYWGCRLFDNEAEARVAFG